MCIRDRIEIGLVERALVQIGLTKVGPVEVLQADDGGRLGFAIDDDADAALLVEAARPGGKTRNPRRVARFLAALWIDDQARRRCV